MSGSCSPRCWAEVDRRGSCLGVCYPELQGRPCDSPGTGSCGDPPAPLQADAETTRCNCKWNDALRDQLHACEERPSAGAVRVFTAGDAGVSCFRIPAVVRTAAGSLLAFAEARHGGCGDSLVHEIAVRRSTDKGKTWSNITFAAGTAKQHAGNPYPIALSSGKVALVYLEATRPIGNAVVFSDDDGVTWGDVLNVSTDFGRARGSLPGPGAGVAINGIGRLLVASHHGAYREDYITYSDDEGKTWTTLPVGFPKMDEATLADLGNGEVLLNMRHRAENLKGRGVSRSIDGGLTWSNLTFDKVLVGPVCQGSLAAFGGSVYFSNPASSSRREKLTVRKSDDGGRTWNARLLLQSGASAGYSSLVQDVVEEAAQAGEDARGGILYESTTPGSIDFATFPLSLEQALEGAAVVV